MPLAFRDLSTRRYRPMLQWLWDADPTEALIRGQLEQIAAAGFGGVCIQPMPATFRPGDFPERLKIPYLGEAYLRLYGHAVQVAGELGLRMWLYDEGGWPSGHAGGLVLADHAHLRGQVLVREAGRFIVERTGRADALKREAIDRFIHLTHDAYARVVGSAFGNTIEAVFSDELTVPGTVGTDRIPWADDMPEQFQCRTGYALADVLPLLFEGSEAAGASAEQRLRARHDFTRVWNELFVERCLLPQRQWCDAHNLKFIGHLSGEHDLSRHPTCFGDYFTAMRCFSMPGIDTIWRQIWPDHVADFALLAGSARLLNGTGEALSESGAVYGLDMTPQRWRWVCDQQVMRGINRFTLMSLTISGAVNEGLSPLALTDPAWASMAELNEHVAVAAALAGIGDPAVARAVLYPSDDLAAHGADGPGAAAQQIASRLQRSPGGGIYVDGKSLMEGELQRGAIRCGQARIESLFLAGRSVVSEPLSRRLGEMHDAGVEVIVVGDPVLHVFDHDPWLLTQHPFDCLDWPGLDRKLAEHRRCPVRRVSGEDRQQVSVVHRKGPDWDLLLLSNESDQPADVILSVPAEGAFAIDVDQALAISGRIPASGQLRLPPGAMTAIAWGKVELPDAPKSASSPRLDSARTIELRNWTIQPLWRLAIVRHRWERQPMDEKARPVELGDWREILGADFSGCVAYETSFVFESPVPAVAWLDLGTVRHVAEIRLNGTVLARRSWPPYAFDIAPLLRRGRNELQVRIGNTPANAYWSERNVADQKAAKRWTIYAERILERCPPSLDAGLIGPVTLRISP